MAAPSTNNVAAAKPSALGGVYYAPIGTALPTDASTALGAGFTALGYVSEDGIQPEREMDSEQIKAWGGDIVAALVTDDAKSFEFTLLEVFSADVQKFVYGEDNVTVTPAVPGTSGEKITVLDKAYKPADCVFVFEMQHDGKKRRVIITNSDNSITGEEPYTDGGLSAYTITSNALKDDDGVRVIEYLEGTVPAV